MCLWLTWVWYRLYCISAMFSIHLSVVYSIVLSHTCTVVRECCKGDDQSQWERGKFDPRHPKTPQPMVTKICVGDYVGDIYHRAKFHPNRFRGFGSMHAWFCAPRHKNWGFGGISPPKWEAMSTKPPKRHILARIRVVWAIKCKNPSSRLTCRWVHKKRV